MDGNRLVVAGVVLVGLFVVFVGLGVLDPVGIRSAMESNDPIETTFQGLLTAIITGVTLVVTINQLVLSQELGAVGDQRERMEGALEFRGDVESVLDESVAPAEPAAFLGALVDEARERAEVLADAADAVDGPEGIRAFAFRLTDSASRVSSRLETARFGTFDVVFAALGFDYSRMIHEARLLRSELVGSGTDEADEIFGRVIEVLALFGPAREHFKTLYFQWELIDLSRAVLYAAVPSLVVTIGMILYLDDPGSLPGATAGVDNLVWVVSGAVTIALIPFVLVLSYILRIATVTKRTLAIGPFLLGESGPTGDVDQE